MYRLPDQITSKKQVPSPDEKKRSFLPHHLPSIESKDAGFLVNNPAGTSHSSTKDNGSRSRGKEESSFQSDGDQQMEKTGLIHGDRSVNPIPYYSPLWRKDSAGNMTRDTPSIGSTDEARSRFQGEYLQKIKDWEKHSENSDLLNYIEASKTPPKVNKLGYQGQQSFPSRHQRDDSKRNSTDSKGEKLSEKRESLPTPDEVRQLWASNNSQKGWKKLKKAQDEKVFDYFLEPDTIEAIAKCHYLQNILNQNKVTANNLSYDESSKKNTPERLKAVYANSNDKIAPLEKQVPTTQRRATYTNRSLSIPTTNEESMFEKIKRLRVIYDSSIAAAKQRNYQFTRDFYTREDIEGKRRHGKKSSRTDMMTITGQTKDVSFRRHSLR